MARIPKIKRNSEFQAIFKSGKIWSNAVAVLYLARADSSGGSKGRRAMPLVSRIGICVSKKLGKATVRNRIKRLIFEVCRQRWSAVRPGCDLIVLARRGALEKSFVEMEVALDELLRRARLYQPKPEG